MAIENKEQCPEAFAFLESNPSGCIASLSKDGMPQVAIVFYIVEDDFSIVFATRSGTRKSNNIAHNPHVAFTVAADDTPKTVQLEGEAHVITDDTDMVRVRTALSKVHIGNTEYYPPLSRIKDGELVLIRITPTYLRWTDYATGYEENESVWSRRVLEA